MRSEETRRRDAHPQGGADSRETQGKQKKNGMHHWVKIAMLLMIYDVVAMNLAYGAALWLRFDLRFSSIPAVYLLAWLRYIPIHTASTLALMLAMKLYRSMWRYASFHELELVFWASLSASLLHTAGTCLFFRRMPVSYYIVGGLFQFLLLLSVRFSYRLFRMLQHRNPGFSGGKGHGVHTLLVGAGSAGRMLAREIASSSHVQMKICCVVDDNPNKIGRYMEGILVAGTRKDIPALVEKYEIQKILLAIPTATAQQKKAVLNICKETGCEVKSLPGMYQMINGDVSVSQLREVPVEMLLGREPVKVQMDTIMEYVSGKVVLVTGGGGSIGSELCRQLAVHKPGRLIILDIYENNAYDIQQELKFDYPELELTVLIGSIQDADRMEDIFRKYRPAIVYHAAAHKHVPLMEASPNEAVKNNVFGTFQTALMADRYEAERFVLISTDKAVNPTNVMGATKRLCEMIVQTMNKNSQTEFVAVRFGNVLGSNGSVIPLFRKQIAAGGPVTVTHRDIIRYFMTIPEAVSLVLQAGAYAKGGEIFLLDMGEPVRIDDLARNLIKLSGFTPDADIPIVYTGLRPGEKLFEEMLMAEEGLQDTENALIHIGKPIEMMDQDLFFQKLAALEDACCQNEEDVRVLIRGLVPTYHEAENGKNGKLAWAGGPVVLPPAGGSTAEK